MNQLLQFFPRTEFQEEVKQTQAERHARGFASWDQFVAMVYCQLADSQSLREIVGGLAHCQGRLGQWGVIKAPRHSTLGTSFGDVQWCGRYCSPKL
jgi:hypothetical protein